MFQGPGSGGASLLINNIIGHRIGHGRLPCPGCVWLANVSYGYVQHKFVSPRDSNCPDDQLGHVPR